MMIPISELDAISEQQSTGGVSVFGHVQVADTFLAWCNMSRQERRVLADKLAAYDAAMADEFAMQVLDAVYETGYYDHVMDAPDPGSERYRRIWSIIQGAIVETVQAPHFRLDDVESELADERLTEQSNRMALIDDEDYDNMAASA